MKVLSRHQRRGGFTLVELMIAASIMGLIGLGLTQGLHLATSTHDQVATRAVTNTNLRASVRNLRNELKSCTEGRIDLANDANGNQILTLQVPVDDGANQGWGVYDRNLGANEAEWNRIGWELRYAVGNVQGGRGELLRQIIDDNGNLVRQTSLADNVLVGPDAGFLVQQTGEVWQVQLTTQDGSSRAPQREEFDVRLRN
ncbi:MAG: prepilin-type N-terminal cleavage/methylation domain-containing protein [Planctomycetota bacterium]